MARNRFRERGAVISRPMLKTKDMAETEEAKKVKEGEVAVGSLRLCSPAARSGLERP